MYEHNRRKGVVSYDKGQEKPKIVVRCGGCGRYLGEANDRGELAAKFYCSHCKTRTEVVGS